MAKAFLARLHLLLQAARLVLGVRRGLLLNLQQAIGFDRPGHTTGKLCCHARILPEGRLSVFSLIRIECNDWTSLALLDVSRPLATTSILSSDIDLLGHLLDSLMAFKLLLVAPSLFGPLRVIR